MTLNLPQAMQQALAAHSRRDWVEAERLGRLVLDAKADYFDALNLLGIIAAQTQRTQEAAGLFGRAVAANPNDASAHNNLGITLKQMKRLDEALGSFERALKIKPDYAEAHYNRGNTLQQFQRLDEALDSYERALKIRPDHAAAHNNRGLVLQELKQPDEALDSYDRALKIRPDYADAHNNRGNALQDLERLDEALHSYERALKIKPDYAEAHYNRGKVLHDLRHGEAALASFDQAIRFKPDLPEAYCDRGNTLQELKRLDEALDSYERALKIKPDYAEAHNNRGIALKEKKRLNEALDSCERALKIKPDYADAHWNLSLLRLLTGDFGRGWEGYEWGWKNAQRGKARRNFSQPLWLGKESLQGKTILLHSEQGLGDTIQFCRYAKLVADLGARVILEIPKPLMDLLADLEGVEQLVEEGSVLPEFDYYCPLLSLPLAFKTVLSTIPAHTPYLRGSPAKIFFWKEKLGEKIKRRVGLVWSGGFRPHQPELWAVNERRNIPLAKFALLRCPDIEFYSLQKGQPAESALAELVSQDWEGPPIADFSNLLADFSDTAALMENLDLVITVDTSTAHLAGAMGKPVWILNRFDTCWRWLLDREDSPWYPTVKLYRQSKYGQWDDVLRRVNLDLRSL